MDGSIVETSQGPILGRTKVRGQVFICVFLSDDQVKERPAQASRRCEGQGGVTQCYSHPYTNPI